MRRIILHIGSPKCGSTYLQRVLERARRGLPDLGLHYPRHGTGTHPGNGMVVPVITRPWLTSAFQTAPTLILSHEDLFARARDGRRLATLAADMDAEVQIVTILRPFDEMLLGDVSQNIKQAQSTGMADAPILGGRDLRQFVWARHKDIQPAHFIAEWHKAVPGPRPRVATLYKLKRTFVDLAPELREIDWTLPQWRSNPSLPPAACAARIAAGRATSPVPDGQPTARQRAWIRSVFAGQAAALEQQFGISLHG
ncbi:MAG: hypothetical protein AAFO93_04210 [Pseudomonadota bacterium]